MANALVKKNKDNTKGRRNKSKRNFNNTPSKSKKNNSLIYLKKDLKDVEYYNYEKKEHYLTTYYKGKDMNSNKIPVRYLE